MATPTQMTKDFGPIIEFVKGANGHIRKNHKGYFAVAVVGDDLVIRGVEGTSEGRDWIREREG